MEMENLSWNATEYKLKFVLDNPNFELPQVVRVMRGYMVDEDNCLDSGQVLTLHGKKNIEKITGLDCYGKDISIPFDCPHKVSLIAIGEPRKFTCVNELSFCENSPKYVSVEAELLTGDGSSYAAHSKFEIIDHSITNNDVVVGISCREDKDDGSGDTIILPINLKCNFTETVSREISNKHYSISELVDRFGLPLQVQFVTGMNGRSSNGYGPSMGVITLTEKYSRSVILATMIVDDIRHALTFSADLPITIQVAKDMGYYESTKAEYLASEIIDGTAFDFISKADPYSSVIIHNEIKEKQQPRRIRNSLSIPASMVNVRNVDYIPAFTPSVSHKSLPMNQLDSIRSNSISPKGRSRTLSLDFHSKENSNSNKSKFGFKYLRRSFSKMTKGSRSSRKSSSKSTSPEYDRFSAKTSDFSDDGTSIADTYSQISGSTRNDEFRQIAQCIDNLTLDNQQLPTINPRLSRISSKDSGICLHRRKNNGSHSGYTVRTLSSNHSDNMSQNISEWNYPSKFESSQNRHNAKTIKSQSSASYLWSADDEDDNEDVKNNNTETKNNNNYDTVIDPAIIYNNIKNNNNDKSDIMVSPLTGSQVKSMEEIKTLNEDGVCKILEILHLCDFKEKIRTNQINGELLLDLEEEELINELKFSLFQAKKITKYIKGWRPEPENLAPNEQSRRNSLNPRDWSLNDVLVHLSTINLPDLGRFCKTNQVNGDLLLDILDNESLQSLRNDHDVKISSIDAKKLKNFVIKGWRPDSSPKVIAK